MIAENIKLVRARIEQACHRVGRDPSGITVIGVTKTFTSDVIREAASEGVLDIGENYASEMLQKQRELQNIAIRWHFIGHLQSNKVKSIIASVHLIHSVDSLTLGQEISRRAAAAGRNIPVLIEVNTSGEASKFGVNTREARALAAQIGELKNISLLGFMTIGPFLPDPEASRPAFRSLSALRKSLRQERIDLPHLSMGMTNDFEIAIEEGATMVRIGTALFGRRSGNALSVSQRGDQN